MPVVSAQAIFECQLALFPDFQNLFAAFYQVHLKISQISPLFSIPCVLETVLSQDGLM